MTLREQVFTKIGWITKDNVFGRDSTLRAAPVWFEPEGVIWGCDLPPIDQQWEVCAKYLVPFMFNHSYDYEALYVDGALVFQWFVFNENPIQSVVKGNNIAEAACEAFMEVNLNER